MTREELEQTLEHALIMDHVIMVGECALVPPLLVLTLHVAKVPAQCHRIHNALTSSLGFQVNVIHLDLDFRTLGRASVLHFVMLG